MAKENRDHYTAVIEIKNTTFASRELNNRVPRESVEERDVREVARVVIRADSIASLIVKATKHLELVED